MSGSAMESALAALGRWVDEGWGDSESCRYCGGLGTALVRETLRHERCPWCGGSGKGTYRVKGLGYWVSNVAAGSEEFDAALAAGMVIGPEWVPSCGSARGGHVGSFVPEEHWSAYRRGEWPAKVSAP